MPLHLLKDQLLDGYASQGPLRQSDPAGAIQSPGELFALSYLRLRLILTYLKFLKLTSLMSKVISFFNKEDTNR